MAALKRKRSDKSDKRSDKKKKPRNDDTDLVLSGRKQKEGAAQGAAREGGSGLRLVRSLTFGETVVELYERDVDPVRETEPARETEEA